MTATLAGAINAGLAQAMSDDPSVLLMGEDIGALGGVFRVTAGLLDTFGEDRVIDTPLAESAIVGSAIGLALRGYRPVCEIQFDGFIFPAFDQITTQLAKLHSRLGGGIDLPVVIRVPFGGGIGAIEHHSESPEALFAHTAGLRVVSPSTPAEAYTMIQAAIMCPDPVLFFEPKSRYWDKGDIPQGSRPTGEQALDVLQTARVVRAGRDVTIATYGPGVAVSVEAADDVAGRGVSVEVLDLRSISPLDIETVAASVARTGRLIVVHEAPVFHGPGAELAAAISERCFFYLQAPVLRVGGYHSLYPPAKIEEEYLPSPHRIAEAIDRSLAF